MIAEQLKLVIEAEVNRAVADLERMDRQSAKSRSGLTKLADKANKVGKAMTRYLTLPIVGAGAAAIKFAADIETQEVALTTMLKSGEKAAAMMEDLQEFSASTPFQFDEIARAGKMMIAFGESSENVVGTLGRIGDVAAGLSIPLGELSEIYGKARVQGRLFAEDLNQLAGRGIPIFDELAKVMGVTAGEVKQLTSEGKVGFAELEQAFVNMTDEGGQFHDLMEAQSQTLSGKLSTAIDNFKLSAAELGMELLPIAKDILDRLTEMFKRFTELDEGTKKFIITAGGIAALAGPITRITGLVLKLADAIKMSGIIKLLGGLGAGGVAAGAGIAGVAVAGGVMFAEGAKEATTKMLNEVKRLYDTLIEKGLSVNEITKQLIDNNNIAAVSLAEQSGLLDTMLAQEAERRANSKTNLHYAEMIDELNRDTTIELTTQTDKAAELAEESEKLAGSSEDREESEREITNQLTEQQKLVNSMSDQIKNTIDQDWARALGLATDLEQILFGDITKLSAVLGSRDVLGIEGSLDLVDDLLSKLEMTDWMQLTIDNNQEAATFISGVVEQLKTYRDELQAQQEEIEKAEKAKQDYIDAMAEDEIPVMERLNELYDYNNQLVIESSRTFQTYSSKINELTIAENALINGMHAGAAASTTALEAFQETKEAMGGLISGYGAFYITNNAFISGIKAGAEVTTELGERILETKEIMAPFVEVLGNARSESWEFVSIEEKLLDAMEEQNRMTMKSSRDWVTYTGSVNKATKAIEEIIDALSDISTKEWLSIGEGFAESLAQGFEDGWEDAEMRILDMVVELGQSILELLGPTGKIISQVIELAKEIGKAIYYALSADKRARVEAAQAMAMGLTSTLASALANEQNWEDVQGALENSLKNLIVETVIRTSGFAKAVEDIVNEISKLFEDGFDVTDEAELGQLVNELKEKYEDVSDIITNVFDEVFDAEQEISDVRIETEEKTIDRLKELQEERLEELERWADEEIYRYRYLLNNDLITWQQYLDSVNDILNTVTEGVPELPYNPDGNEEYGGGGPGSTVPVLPPSRSASTTTVINVTGEVYGIEDLKSRIEKVSQTELIRRR